MFSRKTWHILLLGAVLVLLSLWGWWGGGTASKLFVEKNSKQTTPAAEAAQDTEQEDEPAEADVGKPRLLYDTSTHLRSHPLQDPFHAEAAGRRDETATPRESTVQEKTRPPALQEPTRRKTSQAAPPKAVDPVLKGIMSYGAKRRALVEIDGNVVTVAEGERAGIWTVEEIGEKEITLTAGGRRLVLTTR